MTPKDATKARLRNLFIVASERVLREVYAADKLGTPTAEMIEASHETAVNVFNAIRLALSDSVVRITVLRRAALVVLLVVLVVVFIRGS